MANIKPIDQIANKFATVTPGRAQQYAEGSASPRVDWAQATAAAEGNFESGVQSAIGRKAFGKGVRKAGTAKQKEAAVSKGAVRFGPGVAAAGPAYQQGFAPYHSAIAGVQLPPRRARRDPSNLQRVAAIANALGAVKEARSKV